MEVYRNIKDFKKLKDAVTTVGFFDGVHLGHQKIIKQLVAMAQAAGTASVLLTFDPHPRFYFNPKASADLKLITDLDEKIALFAELGVDHLMVIPFDAVVANMSSEGFIQDIILNTIGTSQLLLGYDHRFGKNREGSFEYLKENEARFGLSVFEISRLDIDEAAVSSTRIREYLLKGQLTEAANLLGRNYSLQGLVVEGKKLGRTLGYPTANIHVQDAHKLLPKLGVYAVEVQVGTSNYGGMLNIGHNPTVSSEKKVHIEVNLFDFDQDIYGAHLKIRFLARLRDEKKFNGLQELTDALAQDAHEARAICFAEASLKK